MLDHDKPRLARLTAILTQLQSRRLVTATMLAEKHGVSIRTIYRDIRALEQSGVPIVTNEGKGYSLVEGYQLPPVMFTEHEANAMITAEQLIRKNKDESLAKHYGNAILKIKSVLNYAQKEEANLLADRVIFRTNPENETTSTDLMTIQSAVTKFQLLEIAYRTLEDVYSVRDIEPFALYSTKENWLLIAYCRLRKDFRVFRIDQIERLLVKNESFTPHDMTLERYFEICRQKSQSTPDIPLS